MTIYDLFNIATKADFDKVADCLLLSDRQKKIFYLKYGRKMFDVDIAEEVGVSRFTVCKETKTIREKMAKIQLDEIVTPN